MWRTLKQSTSFSGEKRSSWTGKPSWRRCTISSRKDRTGNCHRYEGDRERRERRERREEERGDRVERERREREKERRRKMRTHLYK